MVSLRPRESLSRPVRYTEIEEPVDIRPRFAHQNVRFNPELGASAAFPSLAWNDRRQHPNDALMHFCRDVRDIINPRNFGPPVANTAASFSDGDDDDDSDSPPYQPMEPSLRDAEEFVKDFINGTADDLQTQYATWKKEYTQKAIAAVLGEGVAHQPPHQAAVVSLGERHMQDAMFGNVDFGSSDEESIDAYDDLVKEPVPPVDSWAQLPDHMKLEAAHALGLSNAEVTHLVELYGIEVGKYSRFQEYMDCVARGEPYYATDLADVIGGPKYLTASMIDTEIRQAVQFAASHGVHLGFKDLRDWEFEPPSGYIGCQLMNPVAAGRHHYEDRTMTFVPQAGKLVEIQDQRLAPTAQGEPALPSAQVIRLLLDGNLNADSSTASIEHPLGLPEQPRNVYMDAFGTLANGGQNFMSNDGHNMTEESAQDLGKQFAAQVSMSTSGQGHGVASDCSREDAVDLIQLSPIADAPGSSRARTQPANYTHTLDNNNNTNPSASSEYGHNVMEVETDQLNQQLNLDQDRHMVEEEETALRPPNAEGDSELAFAQAPGTQMSPPQTESVHESCAKSHENRKDGDQDKENRTKEMAVDLAVDTRQQAPSQPKRKADDSPEGQPPLKKITRGDLVTESGGGNEQPDTERDPKETEAQGAAASPSAGGSSFDDLPWWKINLANSLKGMMKKGV